MNFAEQVDETVLEQWAYEDRKKAMEEEIGKELTDDEFLAIGGSVQ